MVVIIYAHPNQEGHCGEILKQTKKELKKTNTKYEILDLYKENFDPIYSQKDYLNKKGPINKKIQAIQNLIKKDSKLIFIYPVWWNNMPAILKGFIDKVFTNDWSFTYKNGRPRGLLSGKARIFISAGAPSFFIKYVQKGRSYKVLSKDTLRFCGIKSKTGIVGKATSKVTIQKKEAIKKMVRLYLKHF